MSRIFNSPITGLHAIIWFALFCAIGRADAGGTKVLAFKDPNTNYLYRVTSINATQPSVESPYRSLIRVSRQKLDEYNRTLGKPEDVQTLKFTPTLVDFDIHCPRTHCYLVTVTSRTRRNVELFSWQRTQFDSSAVRDSFARAHAVKLVAIGKGFYIAIAQDQLHLSPHRYSLAASDNEEPTRFMGCAVLKFLRGHEHDIRYHQFIRLPFDPRHVNHFTTINSNNFTDLGLSGPTQNHHLVFSAEPNWAEPEADNVRSFIWSPLNDYFWPYRMPRGAEVVQSRPGTQVIRFPELQQPLPVNLTQNQRQQQEYTGAVERCFYQLQRLLADRDLEAKRMIESSKSIWRAQDASNPYAAAAVTGLTNISAQVIVHGNVIVTGSVIDSPQITLFGGRRPQQMVPLSRQQVDHLVSSHSPAIVSNKFKQALIRLSYIREKISRAILADGLVGDGTLSTFDSQIRFFGPVEADEVIFHGVANSDVRLNGIPFRQLENELVSLNGPQDIVGKTVFNGKVVADRLDIIGLINDHYLLRDAIDITSNKIQVIETTSQGYNVQAPGLAGLVFASINAPDVVLAYNATINSIRLNDLITRDNRTQVVVGRKSFRRLSMAKLDLAHQAVQLNGLNISRIARNAIRLQPDHQDRMYQTISSNHPTTFMKPISANRLVINGIINQHINLTSLIHDSIKTSAYEVQQIFGPKNFLNGLKVNRLNTEGALNDVEVSQIFNLNSAPPVPEQHRPTNATAYNGPYDVPITGEFRFGMPVRVAGSVNANLVNGVDLTRRAIRRLPGKAQPNGQQPQIVRGRKTFYRPLRIINDVRLVDPQQVGRLVNNFTGFPHPLINGIDMRAVSSGLGRHMRQPPPIFVENLEVDGNLDIPTQADGNGSLAALFGNYSACPLELIRSRVVLAGAEEQFIDAPIRINALKAKNIVVEAGALNGFNFPRDFVMRTENTANSMVEPIYGVKTIEHLVVSPAMVPSGTGRDNRYLDGSPRGIVLDRGASINQVPYSELQPFIGHERNLNSTGEKVFNTLNVYGNIYSRRINGYYWPDDILLHSVCSSLAGNPPTHPSIHRRIYSPLIFTNGSNLRVENQLVLRGPIQLNGRMNGVNLTEFSRQSATYGDKDLHSNGRPIRNKIFLGGLVVKNDIRAQGMIDGVNVEEMRRRVVTTRPMGGPVRVLSPKVFTDVSFEGPVRMIYLNGIPIDNYLSRIRFEPDGITLKVRNKKTITGALRINRNLFVRGLINGVDFTELRARAISLAPSEQELIFNKTLIVEGDVFMDNLWIDQHNGTIDGIRLRNLLQVGPNGNDAFALTNHQVVRDPFGRLVRIVGSLMECHIACELQPVAQRLNNQPSSTRSLTLQPDMTRPITLPAQSAMPFTSRPTLFNYYNNTITRTTPPYSLPFNYQPPLKPTPRPVLQMRPAQMQKLVDRRPVSVRYEARQTPSKRHLVNQHDSMVANQLENLRRRIVSINLVRLAPDSLVVGFIDAPTNNVANYTLPDPDLAHYDHLATHQRSYLQLDQIDFPFTKPTMYHLSVGVATNRDGQNITSVSSSLGGGSLHELSVLPVESPNSAMFISIESGALFLLISQDRPMKAGMCPTTEMIQSTDRFVDGFQYFDGPSKPDDGIHVYLFHALEKSSSLKSAYFDLYQTIDLPGVDSFEKFKYGNSSYVLATSRNLNRIYLLLLRGYTGFQLVSHIDAPMVDNVLVMSQNGRPALVIRQTDGRHRVMEAVVI